MGLWETATAVKQGKMKMSEVKPGVRRAIERLLPHVDAKPRPAPAKHVSRGFATARFRNAKSY